MSKHALPALVVIAAIGIQLAVLAQGSKNVRLHDVNSKELEIGRIDAEVTTVGQLKRILSHFLKTEAKSINLMTSNSVHMSDDVKLLTDYSNTNEAEMVIKILDGLDMPGKIVVELPKVTKEITITKDRTLGWLREQIYDLVMNGLTQVVFDGEKLTNYSKTLEEYKLYNRAHILIVPDDDLYNLVVRRLDGQFVDFVLTLDTTVLQLKEIIEARENVLVKDQVLVHYDTMLDDNEKVFSYSKAPKQGLIVELVKRLSNNHSSVVKFSFQTENGSTNQTKTEVTATNTVGELKQFATRVIPSYNPNIVELALQFRGNLLEDDRSKLSELNLYDGALIEVLMMPRN